MSIEKFSGKLYNQTQGGFTVLMNQIFNLIKDAETIGVYAYLCSLPPEWDINTKHLKSKFKIGNTKIYRILTSLIDCGLLEREEVKEAGKFAKYEYKLHLLPVSQKPNAVNGSAYKRKIKTKENKEICTSSVSTPEEMPPSADKPKKDKPQVTKETASYIAIWNELSKQHGLKPVGQNQRQLNSIHKSLKLIKKEWEVTLTEQSFRVWLTQGVNAKHYRLSKFKHRLDICLRWDAFIEIYTLEGVNRVENK